MRQAQNIKTSRAQTIAVAINKYFDSLTEKIVGVPAPNIINNDETIISDDPGRSKLVFKRGPKYTDRIMNQNKSSKSVMFAGTASGKVLLHT